MRTGDLVLAVSFSLAACWCVILTIVHWIRWRRLPAADPAHGVVLVSFGGTRVRVTALVRSKVDDRPIFWRAVDDTDGRRAIPLDGAGWRREK